MECVLIAVQPRLWIPLILITQHRYEYACGQLHTSYSHNVNKIKAKLAIGVWAA